MKYIPLRVHSVYSKGRGGAVLEELASLVLGKKLPAAALSDIENLYAWGRWNRVARETGFAPLFGCEIEVKKQRFLFIVKNREGYWNLMEILNRKKIDKCEGLVVIFIPRRGDLQFPEDISTAAGEDFYLGADFYNFLTTRAWAEEYGLQVVWANPLKFVKNPERLLLLYAMEKKIPFPPQKARFGGRMPLFGPEQDALALKKFGSQVKGLFQMTYEVAEKCEFSFTDVVPPLPDGLFAVTLRETVREKLRERDDLSWKERQRVQMELDVVERSGFAPYFLVVFDVVRFAGSQGILHNLKGSGVSSYLAYLLGISHIDPVEFDLYFERFLNSGRDDPPDFDLDFDSRKRDQVLAYVLKKYGQGKTGAAFVCSLKNYRARSALYETARAFGRPPAEARSMSKKVPLFAQPDFLKKDRSLPGYAEIWKAASDLTSVYCENSLHVGGVILTPAPADRYLPLEKSARGLMMSHFDRDAVEDLRLIKLDLLSVRGLAAVSSTMKSLNLRKIPLRDKKAYTILKNARTIGCFQVESPAMMNLLRRMQPESIYELTQALALIRPGPTRSGMKQAFLSSRDGRPGRRDSFLAKILPETEGLLLYEEQVMQIAERVAGMSADEADLLRRCLKKKQADKRLKKKFFREADRRGYNSGEIKKLWEVMDKFSSYSFNKAHSASYARVAYQAVYLKAHYPLPYLTGVLNAGGGYYGPAEYIEEIKRCGIKILGPDITSSSYFFEVEKKAVRVGLMSIKGLAVKTAEKIIEERKKGQYQSIENFLFRVSLTKSELFTLIKAGAFDSLEPKRTRQILPYFWGVEGIRSVPDLDAKQKKRMLVESLGFDPKGDSLSLFEGERPLLRIKDLKDRFGQRVELLVRVVDARLKGTNNSRKYFFLFEDETGLLEGVGEKKCLTAGSPPACFLQGNVRRDRTGIPKIFNCTFRDF